MQIDDDTVKLLAEIALMAGGYGMTARADAIVVGLEQARPDNERPHLLRAITRLNAKDTATAERILREQALRVNPNSAMSKAFLGIALHMQGRTNERDRVLNEVIAADDDEEAVKIARDLLSNNV
jgi:predicted Zn-dependent protease